MGTQREVIQQLANLAAARARLIEAKKILKTPLQEHDSFSTKKITKQVPPFAAIL